MNLFSLEDQVHLIIIIIIIIIIMKDDAQSDLDDMEKELHRMQESFGGKKQMVEMALKAKQLPENTGPEIEAKMQEIQR